MAEYHNVHLAGYLVGVAWLGWVSMVGRCLHWWEFHFYDRKKREPIEAHARVKGWGCRGSHLIDNQIANRIGLSLNTAIVFLWYPAQFSSALLCAMIVNSKQYANRPPNSLMYSSSSSDEFRFVSFTFRHDSSLRSRHILHLQRKSEQSPSSPRLAFSRFVSRLLF